MERSPQNGAAAKQPSARQPIRQKKSIHNESDGYSLPKSHRSSTDQLSAIINQFGQASQTTPPGIIQRRNSSSKEEKNKTFTVPNGYSLKKISEETGFSAAEIISLNGDKLKTWGSVQGFNAGEIISLPSEKRQKTTPQESIFLALSQYQNGELPMPGLAQAVQPYVIGNESHIITLMEDLGWTERDNFSYALAIRSNDLKAYDRRLLQQMSNALDTLLTFSRSENNVQKQRIDAALNYTPPERVPGEGDVLYSSQMDNTFNEGENFDKYNGKIKGSNMCNVTSLAMQLKKLANDDLTLNNAAINLLIDKGYSGSRESLANQQLEDILLRIFVQLGDQYFKDKEGIEPSSDFGPHQYASGLNHVAKLFPAYVSSAKFLSNIETKEKYTTQLKPELDDGASIILSTKLTGGHIVYLDKILSDGIAINDPYGMRMPGGYVVNGVNVKSKKSKITSSDSVYRRRVKLNKGLESTIDKLISDPQPTTFPQNLGEKNFYTWAEVQTYRIGKWVNIIK